MNILRSIPYSILVPAAIVLGFAPFVPQPHLFEKVSMLLDGTLSKPIDIFDLVMHSSPIILLLTKLLVEKKSNP